MSSTNTASRQHQGLRRFALVLFPLIVAIFALIYLRDPIRYVDLLREDRQAEWLTFAGLFLAGLVALEITIHLRQRCQGIHWFFLLFGVFSILMALEEISWGQRLFAIDSPEYFLSNSDQQEINVHNLLQSLLDFKTKDVAGIVLFGYGVVLPWWPRKWWPMTWLDRLLIRVPPRYLSLGFLLSALLMVDMPTGFEEEIGEMTFGFAFLIFMLDELLRLSPTRTVQPVALPSRWPRQLAITGEHTLVIGLTILSAALRMARLDGQGFWLSEANYLAAAQAGQAGFAQVGAALPTHWPGWLWAQTVWLPLAGSSEYAVRFLSTTAGVLAVPLFWQWLRTSWPRAWLVRGIATLLLALLPATIAYSQELSEHSLLLLLAILSLYLTSRWLHHPTGWLGLGWLTINGLLLLLAPVAGLLVITEAVAATIGLMRAPKRLWWPWFLPIAALLLGILSLLLWMTNLPPGDNLLVASGQHLDADGNTLYERLDLLWLQLNFAHIVYGSTRQLLAIPLLALFAGGLYALVTSRSETPTPAIRWLLAGSVILAAIFAAITPADRPIAPAVAVIPVVILLVTWGIVYLWERIRLIGLFAFCLAVGMAGAGLTFYFAGAEEGYTKSNYRALATTIRANASADDGIVLVGLQQVPLANYYLAPLAPPQPIPPVTEGAQAIVAPQTVVPHLVDETLRASVADHPAVWLVSADAAASDPGNFVANFLTAIAYKADCIAWPDLNLCRFVSPEQYPATLQNTQTASFQNELVLEASEFAMEPATQTLLLALDWHALEQLDLDYKYSVRLIGADGTPHLQKDEFLVGPLLPPTTWNAGDRKRGYMALPTAGLAAGDYRIELVVYDPSTALPIPLTVTNQPATEPLLPLARLQIHPDRSLALANY